MIQVETISRFKKSKYIKELSEDEFRDMAVRPLLLRLGYSDGRDLCGPGEHGKDAIFVEVDKLGFQTVIALQTKKGNLNLAGTTARNLVDAVTQVRTALATSVVFLKDRRKVVPNKAILCASGSINESARRYIIEEVQNPNIQFLDVDDLIPLIDKELPEFWLGIDADLLPYFSAIEKIVTGDYPLARGEDGQDGILSGAASDAAFVSLNLFRTVLKDRKVHGQITQVPKFEELPVTAITAKKSRRILITGEAGSGKSTSMLRLAFEAVKQGIQQDDGYKIPILIKCVDILRNKYKSMVDACDSTTKSLTATTKSIFSLSDLNKGKVLLLIDALDEIPLDSDRRLILKLLDDFHKGYPKCQIVVSSRPYRFVGEYQELKAYEDYRLSPIGWKQAKKIVDIVASHKKMPSGQSQELLRRLERIHGIELNPLLVTVFAATSDFAKQDLPANITELFKKFTELMLGRWDEKKGLKFQYQAPLKDFVLTKIAFNMHSKKLTSLSKSDAEKIARVELETRGYDSNVEGLLDEIFYRSGLFRVYHDQVEFQHHLLQEFFAGRGIESVDFIAASVSDDWWKRAIVFYFGDNPRQIDQLIGVVSKSSHVESELTIEAATTIGLALQACYLSPVGEKINVWKWVVDSLSFRQDGFLKDADPNNERPQSNFATYYLNGRDSVALQHLRSNQDSLVDWASGGEIEDSSITDRRKFWLIVGFIESGEIDEAEKLLHGFLPKDPRLLTAIHMGCYLAYEIRHLNTAEKKAAKAICARLEDKVAPYRAQIVKELGSMLLELRDGKVTCVEGER